MDSYKQVVEKAEFALIKGEYNFCIEYLYPIIESYPPSTKEGANLRTILITALSGINKKELKMLSTNFCYGGEEIYEIENFKN